MATVNFRDDPVRAETSTGNADHDVGSELEGEFNCIYHTGGVANIFRFKVLLMTLDCCSILRQQYHLYYLVSEPAAPMVSSQFCKCGKCSVMDTAAENICCKAKQFLVQMPEGVCITEHSDYEKIINKANFNS